MKEFEQDRRTFLFGLGGLGMSPFAANGLLDERKSPEALVLAADQGEELIHFRDRGRIFIKFGTATGSQNLALGTQQVKAGSGIPVHRHLQMDEAFYILEGEGSILLDDVRHSFQKGATIFIPANHWHGFENPEKELLLLWLMAPPGLDGFFRETCSPPGAPPKNLSREQIKEIARKYGTEFR